MNRFIRVDSQKCIGCRACEVACVMSHNDEQHVLDVAQFLPRITVVKMNQQRGAATCHHCEDAPCARSCPNGAIRQVDDAIQVDQAKCIGCKSCAVACPFGTMQIVLAPQPMAVSKPPRTNVTFVRHVRVDRPAWKTVRQTRCS